MRIIEQFLAGAIGLSLVVILVKHGSGVNDVLRGLGEFNEKTFRTLQGN